MLRSEISNILLYMYNTVRTIYRTNDGPLSRFQRISKWQIATPTIIQSMQKYLWRINRNLYVCMCILAILYQHKTFRKWILLLLRQNSMCPNYWTEKWSPWLFVIQCILCVVLISCESYFSGARVTAIRLLAVNYVTCSRAYFTTLPASITYQ